MNGSHAQKKVLLCSTRLGPMLVYEADAIIGRALATSGHFGEAKIDEVLDFLAERHQLRPDQFIDIGANIGTHTLHALACGRIASATAIEADPDNFLLLAANVGMQHRFARARIILCAISDRQGIVELELCPTNFGDHRVRIPEIADTAADLGESLRATVQVPCRTLDSFTSSEIGEWARSLVWMDTQGHEGHILAGATEGLARCAPAVVMEFWPYGLHRAGGKERYFDYLDSRDFIYDINKDDWPNAGCVTVAELMDRYDSMLRDTCADYYPHTDLLCVKTQLEVLTQGREGASHE